MVLGSKRLLSRALPGQGLRPIINGLAFDRSIEFGWMLFPYVSVIIGKGAFS